MFAILGDYIEQRLGCIGKFINAFISLSVLVIIPYQNTLFKLGWPSWLDAILVVILFLLLSFPLPIPLTLIWWIIGLFGAIFTTPLSPMSILTYIVTIICIIFFALIASASKAYMPRVNVIAALSNTFIILLLIAGVASFVLPIF